MQFRLMKVFSVLFLCLTMLVSVQAQESEPPFMVAGNSASLKPSVSADGQRISFVSDATNLVPDDRNAMTDVFVYDQQTGITSRVSVAADGTEGNDASTNARISADGRFVVFESRADNLVPDDTNHDSDIFVYDLESRDIQRVSVTSDGVEGDSSSLEPAISDDGQRVVFWTNAANLSEEDTNYFRDVFVHDLTTGETRMISGASDGTLANDDTFNTRISADGNVIAFWSRASNMVDGDSNELEDIFVHDLTTGETSRINIASDGSEANGYTFDTFSLSADGRYVAFQSQATNLVKGVTVNRNEIYLHDRQTGETTQISATLDGLQAECSSFCLGSSDPSLSADGDIIVFTSDIDTLVEGDTNETWDIFRHDRTTGTTSRVSVNANGDQLNGSSTDGVVSADGCFVAFETGEALVSGDLNFTTDVYLYDVETGTVQLISGYAQNN